MRSFTGEGSTAWWRGVAIALPLVWLAIIASSLAVVRSGGDDGITIQASSLAPIDLEGARDGTPVVAVVPRSPAEQAGLQTGDTLLEVDGIPVQDAGRLAGRFFTRRAGETSTLLVRGVGDTTARRVTLTLAPLIDRPGVGAVLLSYGATGFVVLLLVVAIALVRPSLPAARVLLLLGGSQSLWQAVDSLYGGVRERWLPLGWDPVDQVGYLGALINVAAVLHLFLLFPEPSPIYRRLGRWVALLYATPVAVAVALFALHQAPVGLLWGIVGAYIVAAVVAVVYAFVRPVSPVARAQLMWVASAMVAALAVLVAGPLVQVASGGRVVIVTWTVTVALWGVFYLAFGLAILRYRLLDVNPVFRATLLYPLLTALLVAAYIGASFLLSQVAEVILGIAPENDTVPAVLAALAVAAAAYPLRVRLHHALDTLLYPERRVIQRYFAAATASLAQALPPEQVAGLLTTQAAAQLNLTGAWLVQPSGDVVASAGAPAPSAESSGADLLEWVRQLVLEQRSAMPLLLVDRPLPGLPLRQVAPQTAAAQWWSRAGARMLVPLAVGSQEPTSWRGSGSVNGAGEAADGPHDGLLAGVWVLGDRQSRVLPDRRDLAGLRSVAQLAAVVLGYAHLLRQASAVQKRIQEQQRVLGVQVEELQRSRRLITMAEERLRRDIAEMLHGRVQTRLLIAWQRLDEAKRLMVEDVARATELIDDIRAELDEVREQEVRQASHLLHPSIVAIGIIPAIRSLTSRFERHFAVTVTVDARVETLDSVIDNHIPEDLRLALYRVTEEALANILRHAAATTVQISLSAGGTEDGEGDAAPGGQITLRVRDDGRGFDMAQVQHGLGVHSMAAWVEQFGGTWRLISAPGAGTELEVRLPLASAQSVLLVDDEPAFLQVAQTLVEQQAAFRVAGTATSGDEALAMLSVLRPDIAIVDVQMPGASGFAVAERIRQAAPRVRVILVSAASDPEFPTLAAQVGAAGFLPKRELSSQAVSALIHPN